ncbi:MAG TPA: aldo/keto reductase [Candidatus Lumbricidophila sp.]|nr:aldo/keto reductase [Candidatus Lumbricidophila sp.]
MSRHAGGVAGDEVGTSDPRTAPPAPADPAAHPSSGELTIVAADSRETGLLPSNPISGLIQVSARRRLGMSDISAMPLALDARSFGYTVNHEDAFALLDYFAACGGTLIHTADHYAGGMSEWTVGRWLASRAVRNQMVVMTKVGRHPDAFGLSGSALTAAVDASLSRLGIDRIDVLSFDGEDPKAPLAESLGAVDRLMAAGKVRTIGAAGFGVERVFEARVLAANGLPRIETWQTPYSLMNRKEFEGAPEVVARAQGIAVLPTMRADVVLGVKPRRRLEVRAIVKSLKRSVAAPRAKKVEEVLDTLSRQLGESPATIALAWLLAQPTVAAPIVEAATPAELERHLRAISLQLGRTELIELGRAA